MHEAALIPSWKDVCMVQQVPTEAGDAAHLLLCNGRSRRIASEPALQEFHNAGSWVVLVLLPHAESWPTSRALSKAVVLVRVEHVQGRYQVLLLPACHTSVRARAHEIVIHIGEALAVEMLTHQMFHYIQLQGLLLRWRARKEYIQHATKENPVMRIRGRLVWERFRNTA
jgi:hypothetical protein